MKTQLAAIAQRFGISEYSIHDHFLMVGDMQLKIARMENSCLIFKYPHKQNPFKDKINQHQNAAIDTVSGLFSFDKKSFLNKYSITHYIAVDKNNNNNVLFYTTYTKKKEANFPLDIKLFGIDSFRELDFTVVSDHDDFYIAGINSKQFLNLKEYFMVKNCEYKIKSMFGSLDNFNTDLIDMCFI